MMQNESRRRSRNGFTLLELIIIFVIIAILAAVLFGVFQRVRENGKRTVCLSNLHQISLALQQYVSDNGSRYPAPPHDNLREVLAPYMKSKDVFICPSAWYPEQNDQYSLSLGMTESSWKAQTSNGRHEVGIPAPSDIVSIFELVGNEEPKVESSATCLAPGQAGVRHFNGNNYAYVDGHVKWLSAQQWADEFCRNLTKYPDFYSQE